MQRFTIAMTVLCALVGGSVEGIITPEEIIFTRGDANNDGVVDQSDAVKIQEYLYNGGAAPVCMMAADVNGDDAVDNSDPIYLLNYLYNGGSAPPTPGVSCGKDTGGLSWGLSCYQTQCP